MKGLFGRLRRRSASWPSVRPTARGWQALIAGVVVLFVARLIGTTQFHQLAYALLALPLAALVVGLLGVRGLGFSRALPPGLRVTAGRPARLDLLLRRPRFGASRASIMDRLPEQRRFEVPPGEAGTTVAVPVPLYFARRGIHRLGPAEVSVVEGFGLLRFVRLFEKKTEVVVYPPVHDLHDFPLRGGNVEVGAQGSRGRRGDEFASLREYRHGDDRRHIHWKSLARTGDLYVKEFAVQAPRRYAVLLDLRREGLRVQEDEVEDAVSAAASALTLLKNKRLPFRLVGTGGSANTSVAPFGSDEDSYWSAMRLLATVRADGGRPFGEAVLAERGDLGEGVVLISRTRDDQLPDAVRRLRASGLSVAVVALATHTYRMSGGSAGASGHARNREAEFSRSVGRLEASGAAIRILERQSGVAGLSGSGSRQAGAN